MPTLRGNLGSAPLVLCMPVRSYTRLQGTVRVPAGLCACTQWAPCTNAQVTPLAHPRELLPLCVFYVLHFACEVYCNDPKDLLQPLKI